MPTAAEPSPVDAQLISTVSCVEQTMCIAFSGQLDLVVEHELTAVVAATASTPDVAALHFDLTQVTFIDSSGLRGLILSSQAALDRGSPSASTSSTADPSPAFSTSPNFAVSSRTPSSQSHA